MDWHSDFGLFDLQAGPLRGMPKVESWGCGFISGRQHFAGLRVLQGKEVIRVTSLGQPGGVSLSQGPWWRGRLPSDCQLFVEKVCL